MKEGRTTSEFCEQIKNLPSWECAGFAFNKEDNNLGIFFGQDIHSSLL